MKVCNYSLDMKILLISPHPKKTRTFAKLSFPPLNLQQIAASTPPNYLVDIVDESFETTKKHYATDYDLIGIGSVTYTALRAYELADKFRREGKTVVLGGWHPSALPEEAKHHADSVIIGEAEDTWPQLLKDHEQGKLKPYYEQNKSVDLNKISMATHNLNSGFYFYEGLEASRGCPMGCNFCAITNSCHGRFFRMKQVSKVKKEINSIKKRYICFYDPTLTINPDFSIDLFKEMKNLNKKFICHGNIDILLKREDLLKAASEAGCITWSIGFDSVSQESVDSTGRKSNKVIEYRNIVDKIHDYNMTIDGTFMFGFDSEENDIFEKTSDLVNSVDIDNPIFNTLTPFPGTPLYTDYDKQGRITTKNWEKYDLLNVVFQPKKMTPEDLLNGTKDLRKEFHSNFKTIKRTIKTTSLGYHPFKMTALQNFNFMINRLSYMRKS
ncbi:MAG: B12-binding domain-containing radical SAM protein [Thermoplasmatales archaeon]|nr:MAG: B12-binding domain-containing radical SAM protein [Thermoplasmatales archaeon]